MDDKPVKVLLIEDNAGDARLIREMLSEASAPFKLECADRLSAGLERLKMGGIDIVLTDLGLPDSQGLATFTRLYAEAPPVPILVLTVLFDEDLGVTAVQKGAQDYLVKGQVDSNLLVRAIRYAIERGRIEERERQLRQQLLAQVELENMKSQLLSTVSHELRTPLASIKGYSTLLLDYDRRLRRAEKRQHLEAVDRAADRLTELIDHLLDMSRLEAGLLRLDMTPTSIYRLVQEAVAEAQLRSPEHYIKAELKGELPPLKVDDRRIHQVLDNLLDNAIKYSDKGSEVMVRAKANTREVEISVTDQGRGIPAAEIPQVFNRMYRLERRLSSDAGGLGLGLALCKALVEAHHGRIWLESREGKGTTVCFSLPLVSTKETDEEKPR